MSYEIDSTQKKNNHPYATQESKILFKRSVPVSPELSDEEVTGREHRIAPKIAKMEIKETSSQLIKTLAKLKESIEDKPQTTKIEKPDLDFGDQIWPIEPEDWFKQAIKFSKNNFPHVVTYKITEHEKQNNHFAAFHSELVISLKEPIPTPSQAFTQTITFQSYGHSREWSFLDLYVQFSVLWKRQGWGPERNNVPQIREIREKIIEIRNLEKEHGWDYNAAICICKNLKGYSDKITPTDNFFSRNVNRITDEVMIEANFEGNDFKSVRSGDNYNTAVKIAYIDILNQISDAGFSEAQLVHFLAKKMRRDIDLGEYDFDEVKPNIELFFTNFEAKYRKAHGFLKYVGQKSKSFEVNPTIARMESTVSNQRHAYKLSYKLREETAMENDVLEGLLNPEVDEIHAESYTPNRAKYECILKLMHIMKDRDLIDFALPKKLEIYADYLISLLNRVK